MAFFMMFFIGIEDVNQDDEDDLDDEQLDEMVLISDWNWGSSYLTVAQSSSRPFRSTDCGAEHQTDFSKCFLRKKCIFVSVWERCCCSMTVQKMVLNSQRWKLLSACPPVKSSCCSVTSHQPVRGSTFIVYCTNKYEFYVTWILHFIQLDRKKLLTKMLSALMLLCL